ncbi:MAG: hypothetical protein WC683_07715 [bacterium]|jgi:hypothetical protein
MSDVLTTEEWQTVGKSRGWDLVDRDKLVAIIDRLVSEVTRLRRERDRLRRAGYHEALDAVEKHLLMDDYADIVLDTSFDFEELRARYSREEER